jgi:hypothetical protein
VDIDLFMRAKRTTDSGYRVIIDEHSFCTPPRESTSSETTSG